MEILNIVIFAGPNDYEELQHVLVPGEPIRFFTTNNEVTLEYNDTVILRYLSEVNNFVQGVESMGEFIRDTTTINIIDNDGKL